MAVWVQRTSFRIRLARHVWMVRELNPNRPVTTTRTAANFTGECH